MNKIKIYIYFLILKNEIDIFKFIFTTTLNYSVRIVFDLNFRV